MVRGAIAASLRAIAADLHVAPAARPVLAGIEKKPSAGLRCAGMQARWLSDQSPVSRSSASCANSRAGDSASAASAFHPHARCPSVHRNSRCRAQAVDHRSSAIRSSDGGSTSLSPAIQDRASSSRNSIAECKPLLLRGRQEAALSRAASAMRQTFPPGGRTGAGPHTWAAVRAVHRARNGRPACSQNPTQRARHSA